MELEKWLDNTKIGTFERCPREFFLRHVLFLTRHSEGSVATEFGKAFHSALELFFSGKPVEEAIQLGALKLQESLSRLAESGNERVYEDGRADIDTFVRALQYFLNSGAGRELSSLIKDAKCELKLRLVDKSGWELLGRIDLLAETHSGQIMIVDFKTTGWSIKSYAQKILTDTQLQTYALIVKETAVARTVHAGAYAVLYVKRARLKSGQLSPSISLDSALLPLALTQDHLDRALARFRSAREEIERAYSRMHFPCIWSQCQRIAGICQFHPLCERFWRTELTPQNIEHIYEVAFGLDFVQHRWHPFEDDLEMSNG